MLQNIKIIGRQLAADICIVANVKWGGGESATKMVLYCVPVPKAINKLPEYFRHLSLQKRLLWLVL